MPLLNYALSNVLLALVLALTAAFVQRRLRRPGLAHVLWVLVLVKLVTPPLVSVPLGRLPGSLACTLGACGCDHQSRTQTFVRDTLPWMLLVAWASGAVVTAWTAWRRWAWFRRLTAHARLAPPEWQALAARLVSELGIRRPPEILAVPGRLPPFIIPGPARARLMLPRALVRRLRGPQRAALLTHEFVHIKRGDPWIRLLELTIHVVYWWLPVVGAIGRQLRACEEACCDAAVVTRLPEARREYAALLLDALDFTNPSPGHPAAQATAMSAAHDLEQRLRVILAGSRPARRAGPAATVAVGLACAVLPCSLCYDWGGRAAPTATSAEPAATPWGTKSFGCPREYDPPVFECCPS
jgi:beta-lactamase regulating signal transducer with metallopeptidase domain